MRTHNVKSAALLAIVLGAEAGLAQLPYPSRPNISGRAVAWGRDYEGQTNIPTNALSGVCAVIGHHGHSVALKTNGTIVTWGSYSNIPTEIGGYPFSTITNAVKIQAYSGNLGILASDGTLAISGVYPMPNQTFSNVVDFGLGLNYRVMLNRNGEVQVSEFSYEWQNPAFTPIPANARSNIVKVVGGYNQAGAIDSSGRVTIWGTDYPPSNPLTIPPEAQANVVDLAIGWGHAVALKNDGSIMAWGNNDWGQCTIPPEAQSNNVVGIVADEAHSAALLNDGRIIVWGTDQYGQKQVPSGNQFMGIGGWGNTVYGVSTPRRLLVTSVNNSDRGSVTSGGYMDENSAQMIQATPNPGYIFSGWEGDVSGSANPTSILMNADKNVVAVFSQDLSDDDSDGLSNFAEIIVHGSNPNQADSNLDGISDLHAVGLDYSPNFNFGPFLGFMRTNIATANSMGLYTTHQIHNLGLGGVVVGRNANNQLVLTYRVMQSTDLQTWSNYHQAELVISNAPPDKMFLRVQTTGQ
jgi:alpha-tubulin suppressor-like RCC1 family protein